MVNYQLLTDSVVRLDTYYSLGNLLNCNDSSKLMVKELIVLKFNGFQKKKKKKKKKEKQKGDIKRPAGKGSDKSRRETVRTTRMKYIHI